MTETKEDAMTDPQDRTDTTQDSLSQETTIGEETNLTGGGEPQPGGGDDTKAGRKKKRPGSKK